MFKERWPIRRSPDEMQFARPNESLSLSPWNASFQTHRNRPSSSYGTELPASTRLKKKKKKRNVYGATYEKPRKKKWKSTRVLRDTCSNRPDFVRVFDDPSFIKYPFIFESQRIIFVVSFPLLANLYILYKEKINRVPKDKKKKSIESRSNLIVWLSNLLDCRPRSNEKREKGKEREKIGGGNATSVIKTRWNTSVDAINLIISHSLPFPSLSLQPSPCIYIFSFPLIRRSELAPSTTSNDLFYYLVDLVAATVYWNPRRSEIMRRTTRPDARLLPRSRYETANYRGRDELSNA